MWWTLTPCENVTAWCVKYSTSYSVCGGHSPSDAAVYCAIMRPACDIRGRCRDNRVTTLHTSPPPPHTPHPVYNMHKTSTIHAIQTDPSSLRLTQPEKQGDHCMLQQCDSSSSWSSSTAQRHNVSLPGLTRRSILLSLMLDNSCTAMAR